MFGVVGAAFLGAKYKTGKEQLKQAEKELDFQQVALGFSEFVEEWASINAEIRHLMATTMIDRFIIFRAWNGYLSPKWTTAIYQQRAEDQEIVTYIHVDLDEDYQERIRSMIKRNDISFLVDEIPESSIKSIYLAEGVTSSYWAFLHSFSLANSTSRAVVYCSFATHADRAIDEATLTKCRLLSSRLRGIVQDMHRRNE
jgi:hypothetical protein